MSRNSSSICEKLHELEAWGVPVEQQFVRNVEEANRGLVLEQTGSGPENIIFATKSGRVELIASLAISNISARDILVHEIHLGLPFFAPDFHLIPLPPRAARQALPALGPCPFEKSELLNARMGRRFVICSGLSVEGLLLAEGSGMVPKEYPHGATVGVEVIVFANKSRRYANRLSLRVERQDQARCDANGLRRQHLFEPDGDALYEHNARNERMREPVRD